jgi:hypothetical protein
MAQKKPGHEPLSGKCPAFSFACQALKLNFSQKYGQNNPLIPVKGCYMLYTA